MPKDDSFYEDHTNRLWARWERANALVFYDSEEEERHEQELQAMRPAGLRQLAVAPSTTGPPARLATRPAEAGLRLGQPLVTRHEAT